MASVTDEKPILNRSQENDGRSIEKEHEKLIELQQERASEERLRIFKYLNINPGKSQSLFTTSWVKKKRLPCRYSINGNKTELIILQGDITKTKIDAVVNAANEHMTGGSGVDGIIHQSAGPDLRKACAAHKQITRGVRLPTGHSRILLSYNMKSTTHYIINTAGPVYSRYHAQECADDLGSCYETALALANLYNLESIGFTAISCGIFGYPANDGAEVALKTVNEKAESIPVVVFVLWDDHIYDAWAKKAEELGFIMLIGDSELSSNLVKRVLVDGTKQKATENRTENSDNQAASKSFNPNVIDASSQDRTPDADIENLSKKLPSDPNEQSDTQQTMEIEDCENAPNANNQLDTQKTVDMASVDQEESDKSDDQISKPKPLSTENSHSEATEHHN